MSQGGHDGAWLKRCVTDYLSRTYSMWMTCWDILHASPAKPRDAYCVGTVQHKTLCLVSGKLEVCGEFPSPLPFVVWQWNSIQSNWQRRWYTMERKTAVMRNCVIVSVKGKASVRKYLSIPIMFLRLCSLFMFLITHTLSHRLSFVYQYTSIVWRLFAVLSLLLLKDFYDVEFETTMQSVALEVSDSLVYESRTKGKATKEAVEKVQCSKSSKKNPSNR